MGIFEFELNDQSGSCRFERPPITEPKDWWHKMPVAHKNVYKRIPLDHVGAENAISEHTIARAHDRAAPLQLKMFYSNNYGKRSFAATDTKVRWTGTGKLITVYRAVLYTVTSHIP